MRTGIKLASNVEYQAIQFWSILSILTINKLHQLIDKNGYQDNVKVISSIYDSIYIEVDEDPTIIKWVNDNLIRCMTQDFMPDQRIPNSAESEIGDSWANLHKISNGASLEEISEIIHKIRNSKWINMKLKEL